jgi:hypothetical protein
VAQGVGPEFKPQNCKKKKKGWTLCIQDGWFIEWPPSASLLGDSPCLIHGPLASITIFLEGLHFQTWWPYVTHGWDLFCLHKTNELAPCENQPLKNKNSYLFNTQRSGAPPWPPWSSLSENKGWVSDDHLPLLLSMAESTQVSIKRRSRGYISASPISSQGLGPRLTHLRPLSCQLTCLWTVNRQLCHFFGIMWSLLQSKNSALQAGGLGTVTE